MGQQQGDGSFLLQDSSMYWVGLDANASRLGLGVSNDAVPLAAHCVMCPGAPLSAASWSLFALLVVLLALLPRGIAMANTHRRPHRKSAAVDQEQIELSEQWPTRSRLWGVSGALVELGWLMLLAGLIPLALWIFADAWPGHGGWYLSLLPPGGMLMLLVFRPTDPPG